MQRKVIALLGTAIICVTCKVSSAEQMYRDFNNHMKYLSKRDRILSENIANADVPNYKPKDLYKLPKSSATPLTRTHSNHISIEDEGEEYRIAQKPFTDIKPNGNAVDITKEMQDKSENAIQVQEAINVYSAMRGMFKIAATGERR